MAKVIKNFKIDLSSVAAAGATRQFNVIGDDGAIFSLEIKNEDGYYYNFSTNTFTATHKRLKNKRIDGNAYNGFITFPSVGDPDQYDIYLYAESMHDTAHADYIEVRFGDGSLDINSSTGSNSNLLKKVLYQYDDVVVTLGAISPKASFQSTGNFVSMTVSSESLTVGRGRSSGKTAFTIAVTTATDKSLQIARQPTISDLTAYTSITIDSGVIIPGEDIWAGTVRSSGLVVAGDVTSGQNITMDDDVSATRWRVGDRVTGAPSLDDEVHLITAINVGSNAKVFTIDNNAFLDEGGVEDDETLIFTPPYYYRWSVASGSTIHQLVPGMNLWTNDVLIGTGENTISSYEDTTTYTTEIQGEDGSIEEVVNTVTNVSVPALDPSGFKPVITNGLVSQQRGNITFTNPVKNDLAGKTLRLFAYGPDAIKVIHNTEIKITNLKVELAETTTTTTAAVNNSTTIPVTERRGTVANVSTIDGIGIDTSAQRSTDTVNGAVAGATAVTMDTAVASKMAVGDRVTGDGIPSTSVVTVQSITSTYVFEASEKVFIDDGITLTFTPHALPIITSATDEGSGSWTASTVQTLESGITLTVGGTSKRAVITGDIEFINVDSPTFSLNFDVEKFLIAT